MRKLTLYFSAIRGHVAGTDWTMMSSSRSLTSLLAPEEAGAVLDPLEVRDGDAAGVGEDVRHDQDALLVQDLVGALRRRAVGAFDDDLRP